MKKKFKYDGKSRPSTNLYKKNFDRIFGKSTAQLLEEVEVKEKTLHEELMEGFEKEQKELNESYEQSKRNRSERVDDE
jgi:hypothetical protein